MKKIKIDGLSQDKVQFGTKVTIVSGKEKYSFFYTKKDGTTTKAFDQFRRLGFSVGDTVEAMTKEEDKSFVVKDGPKKGQTVNYKQRTILYFQEAETVKPLTKPVTTNIDAEIKSEDLPF